MRNLYVVFAVVIYISCAAPAPACDLCAIYRGTEAKESKPGPFLGLSEQFTHFGTLQLDGREVPNTADQRLDSSITQLIAGYQIMETFGVQVTVPYIYRVFKRPEGFKTDIGNEKGVGDVSLVGNLRLYEYLGDESFFVLAVFGGVKFPTGDPARIKEELRETEPPPGAPESGIHGHDLALGSGSYDGIVGTSAAFHLDRFFSVMSVQYAIRSRGEFDYRYANDLLWSVKPGYYLIVEHDHTLGLQLAVTGESKGKDRLGGVQAQDTGVTSVFLGPELSFTWKDSVSVDLGADFPVIMDNTSLQLVPDYKLRAALVWRL